MAPGLFAGDHLLVLREAFDPRTLDRWDVVLLDPAVDAEASEGYGAVAKRVAGLPGEVIEVREGDVWISGRDGKTARRVVKPDDLTDALLVPLHSGDGLTTPWSLTGRELVAPGRSVFSSPLHDGDIETEGSELVRDTALRVTVDRAEGTLVLGLREGADVYRARLADGGGASLHHNLSPEPLAVEPSFVGLHAGSVIQFSNVDDRLRLVVDGVTVLACDDVVHTLQAPGTRLLNAPELSVEQGRVELGDVLVLRDVHYGAQGAYGRAGAPLPRVTLGPDQVFVLGDQSVRSHDSRHFGPVGLELLLGRPVARYLPWERAGRLTSAGIDP